jgi:hypothetical protein
MVMTAGRFSARRGLGPFDDTPSVEDRREAARITALNASAAAKQHLPAIG